MSAATCLLLLMWSSCLTSSYCYNCQHVSCPVCGSENPNNNQIDLEEPKNPGPFTGLTTLELRQLRAFLERDPNIRATKPETASLDKSVIFSADLFLPPKADVLKYLDQKGNFIVYYILKFFTTESNCQTGTISHSAQPPRKARVTVLRGDKKPPSVEEYVCSPLPNVRRCQLLKLSSRKNPINFNFRPNSDLEIEAGKPVIYKLDQQLGDILLASYGERFTNCTPGLNCLTFSTSPVGSGLIKNCSRRLTWLQAEYFLPFYELHPLNFAALLDSTGSDPSKWFVEKLWYGNRLFQSVEDFISAYNNNSITKLTIRKPDNNNNLFSSSRRRGDFQPRNPQRPPTLVEPDGKRYSIKNSQVTYLDWTFHYHMSATNGPAVYDVRFRGERIMYELALSEVVVFYSGYMPFGNTANFVDSSTRTGTTAKGLVPGGDCPDTATLIPSVFMSLSKSDPDVYNTSICIFENNYGYPLRRHMSYTFDTGSFYGGMMNSALIFRTALAITNYDYIVDIVMHQNGVLEVQVFSAGYVVTVYYSTAEKPYGFQVHKNILGNVHHHLFHFKADLDIKGTSNRYSTLDLKQELGGATAFPDKLYSQLKISPRLKESELGAVYDYNFEQPMYHVVYNEREKNQLGDNRSYRIKMNGMSKQLLAENVANERTIPWARHQMVFTQHKDSEISSSSPYGMYDSLDPSTDFTQFYTDNETIVDQDLVLWLTCGIHHIPNTEDIPTTPTAGHQISFSFHPFGYFEEDPSIGSRDAIYIDLKNPLNPPAGVTVNRHGNSRDQCLLPQPSLEEDVAADPSRVLQITT